MSFIRVRRPAEDSPAETVEIEGEIRNLVRKEFATARGPLPVATRPPPQPAEGDDQGVGQANSLIQRLAGASVLEIEKLVGELQGLRDFLRREADCVKREMTGYVHLSDAARKSTKIIADSVSQWKQPAGGLELKADGNEPPPAQSDTMAAMEHADATVYDAQGLGTGLSAAQQHTTPAETEGAETEGGNRGDLRFVKPPGRTHRCDTRHSAHEKQTAPARRLVAR